MYATVTNPWQSSAAISPWQTGGFIPQQYITAQPFQTIQHFPQAQAYSLPVQSGTANIPPMGYSQPYSSAMFSPTGNIQTGFIPQGSISYGYYPGWGWGQIANQAIGGQFVQMAPQMQGQMQQGLTTGIRAASGFAQPRVELAETSNDVIVTADLPNVDPNNVYVTVTDDSLSISALAHLEGISSSLHRTVALPTSVRSEHLDISFTNGTLECRLPKSDFAARRRVKVNATG